MRLLVLLVLLCVPLRAGAGPPATQQAAPGPRRIPDGAFVRAAGADFVVGGTPFTFVGANFDGVHGEDNRRRVEEVLQALVADGMTVGRMWALGESTADQPEGVRRWGAFRVGPEGFVEETYRQLDRVLVAARERGLRLILTLSNHWGDHGGIPMYLRWAGLPAEGLGFEAFYSDERVRGYFRAGLERLLARTNTVSGGRYVDDPTIFSWELMNESAVLTAAGAQARRRWIVEMARYIKARDPHHLVGAGLIGYGMRAERAEWLRVHALQEVDYCDSHLYPQEDGQVQSWERLRDFLDDRAQLARFVIGKPLVLGEFGFRTDSEPAWLGWPRARWFQRLVAHARLDGAAGVLVWIYQPFYGRQRNYGIYVDRGDTDDVRAALRAAALLPVPARNQRLSAASGAALLYEPYIHLKGVDQPHDGWASAGAEQVLEIPPAGFAEAEFERAGVWKGGMLVHAYGADTGRFVYHFVAPPPGPALRELRISARLSSEWPGTVAPPDGGSPVRVLLDDQEVGVLSAVPDDGLGRLEEVRVRSPAVLQRLRAGVHALTLAVPDVPGAHGLCVYGAPTGNAPAPPGDYPPIRLRSVRARPTE